MYGNTENRYSPCHRPEPQEPLKLMDGELNIERCINGPALYPFGFMNSQLWSGEMYGGQSL